MKKKYDLIIIGLGVAGMNAALYAKRANLDILVIEKEMPGGTLNTVKEIENFIGYEKISGPELAINFYKQFKSLKVPMHLEEVISLENSNGVSTIVTNKETYEAKAVIIATGRGPKKLSIGLDIQGISYCTLCDANLYQDKTVAIYGSNPKTIEEALYLSDIAKKVYLIVKDFKTNIQKDNIEIISNEEIKDLVADKDNKLKEIILTNQSLEVEGLFLNLGYGPATYFCPDLVNAQGYIEVGEKCETSVPGIYACGDNIQKDIYQIINAASEGAIAAINANKYVKSIK